eukprot:m.9505 g.9505  ORF g.9505 m.9505 type:complete len:50 (+) comp4075_c0_seq1:1446-1595(+)
MINFLLSSEMQQLSVRILVPGKDCLQSAQHNIMISQSRKLYFEQYMMIL